VLDIAFARAYVYLGDPTAAYLASNGSARLMSAHAIENEATQLLRKSTVRYYIVQLRAAAQARQAHEAAVARNTLREPYGEAVPAALCVSWCSFPEVRPARPARGYEACPRRLTFSRK
jgi:hypothetical protein